MLSADLAIHREQSKLRLRLRPAKPNAPAAQGAPNTSIEASLWALELSKTSRALTLDQAALIEQFVGECVQSPDEIHELLVDADHTALKRAARAAMTRLSGERTGARFTVFADAALAAKFIIASAAGLAGCVLAALQIAFEGKPRRPHRSRVVPLMHAEMSTRTRHLLRVLAKDGYCGDVIIVGRPQRALGPFAFDLRREFGLQVRLMRCFSARDIMRACLGARDVFARGLAAARLHPSNPSYTEIAGIFCRTVLGEAAAAWWRRLRPADTTAVYAHTGTTDTTRLEIQQQDLGLVTVHFAHGVSHGQNFTALSSVGVFQCAHDARWHTKLGGYHSCLSLEEPPPPLSPAKGNGLVVLSNLIHPMNPHYRRAGAEAELRFIELVARALNLLRQRPETVLWRPHPVFATEPAPVRMRVTQALANAGLALWPATRDRNDVKGLALALSTPSTAAIDMLRLGLPAIICGVEAAPAGSVYHQFETVGADPQQIAQRLQDSQRFPYIFSETWRRVGPGAQPGWTSLRQMAPQPDGLGGAV